MLTKTVIRLGAFSGLLLAFNTANADTGDVVRYPLKASDFPIAAAVELKKIEGLVFLSGMVPRDNVATKTGSITEAQTTDVLQQVEDKLLELGLHLDDVVKMQVFLVGDTKLDNKMDFDGFMRGYGKFFAKNKNGGALPARSTFQVQALAKPSYLVEIEVTAVRR
ncbi:Rid family hydrolase [Pseudomonas sp. PP3]|uniref:Rid family hydrolase n=1 Tax=Pseudomonas sp. PP3 TaxID=2815936 RepID=UPI001BAEFC22|nr:Rid family hydrolase [Pseudomonas sp. PP3]